MAATTPMTPTPTPNPYPSPSPSSSSSGEGGGIPVYREPSPEATGKGDGDGEAKGKGEGEGEGKFRRSGCGLWVKYHTDFLFEHDWVGVFRGLCFACSDYDDKAEFTRASKSSWLELQKTRGLHHERAREIEHKGMVALMRQIAPDLSNNAVRTLSLTAVARIKAFAAALSAAISEDPWLKESAEKHTAEFMATLQQQASHPLVLPNTDGRVLDATSIGYLTYIGGPLGLAVSWLRRAQFRLRDFVARPRSHFRLASPISGSHIRVAPFVARDRQAANFALTWGGRWSAIDWFS